MVMKSRDFWADLILVMDVWRDSKRRSLADFATRSSSLESTVWQVVVCVVCEE